MAEEKKSGMAEVFGRQDFNSWEDSWERYVSGIQEGIVVENGQQDSLPYSRGIPYEYVMEGPAHDPDRDRVHSLRMEGMDCGAISGQTGISEERVKGYLKELGLPETGAVLLLMPQDTHGISTLCPVCGERIVQPYRGRHKKFCSDACRYAYWNQKHRDGAKNGRTAVCETCGKEFIAVNETIYQRHYCCWPCYFRARYGRWPRRRVR